jgi:hypothetical protein
MSDGVDLGMEAVQTPPLQPRADLAVRQAERSQLSVAHRAVLARRQYRDSSIRVT